MSQEKEQNPEQVKALPASKKPSKPSRSPWGLLAVLLAALAAGGTAYLFWLGQQKEAELHSELGQLRQQQLSRADLRAELGFRQTLEREADELRAANRQLESRLLDQQQSLQQIQQQLIAMGKTDRSDWLLAEAEYLLRLANQRLLMGRDVKGAAKMLAAADSILVEVDDAGLNPVRASIAEERAALQTAASFDAEGLYLRVRAVATSAEQLKLFEAPVFEVTETVAESGEQSTVQRWWQHFRDAFSKLENYIRIEQRREHFQPLLAPEQEAALRYSLQLMFEQAQLSLLAGKDSLYQLSLQRAADSIEQHYLLDERAQQVLGLVKALRSEPVSVETPDISASLRALKQYTASVTWSRETGGSAE